MTPGPGGTPRWSYAVAGLRVTSAAPLPGLDTENWADGEVAVRFGVPAPHQGRWMVLPQGCGWEGVVAEDGCDLLLADSPRGPSARSVAVRRAVPFAAILQGRLTLHAAAVMCPDGAAAWTGGSGSGKSTLAAALGRLGVRVLADDLLPCRVSGGRHAVPVRGAGGEWVLEPLTRIYFLLPRDPGATGVVCTPMERGDAVLNLVRNGFGELPVASVWRRQVAAYVALAEQVQAFALRLPEGLDRLAAAAGEVAALLGRGASA